MSKLLNRRIWIIRDLLDKPLRQKDIIGLWRYRGETQYKICQNVKKKGNELYIDRFCKKPKKLKDGVGISKGELSKIITGDPKNNRSGLIEESIVKPDFIGKEKAYRLVEDTKALYNILREFSDPILPEYFKREIRNDLINSEYAKKLIDTDLNKNSNLQRSLDLDQKEMEFILLILKNSPSALLKVLDRVYNNELDNNTKWVETYSDDEIKDFKMNIQFKFYDDLNNNTLSEKVNSFNIPLQVEFKLETSIKTKKEGYKYVNTFQNSSLELLSKEEIEEHKMTKKLNEKYEIENNPISYQINKKVDKPFDLKTSPLVYE